MESSRRVLIATSEQLVGDLLASVLGTHGYDCTVEASTTVAYDRIASEPPALAIVDVASLGQAGLDLIADVRLTNPEAALLAVTGRARSATESTVYSLGVTDIVRRDDDVRQLLEALDDLGRRDGRAPDTPPDAPAERPAGEPVLDQPTTILVADDDESVRHLLERVLKRQSYRVLTAVDGIEAHDVLMREAVDLLFLDLKMPRLGGLALLRRLAAWQSPPRVVVVSGLADRDLKLETIKLGAFDYLEKPVSVDRLLITASAALVLDRTRSRAWWKRWGRR